MTVESCMPVRTEIWQVMEPNISRGSVATHGRYVGGIFYHRFTVNLLENLWMKGFRKLVRIWLIMAMNLFWSIRRQQRWVADRVEGLREIEGYDDDIWVGLEQTSDGMKKRRWWQQTWNQWDGKQIDRRRWDWVGVPGKLDRGMFWRQFAPTCVSGLVLLRWAESQSAGSGWLF